MRGRLKKHSTTGLVSGKFRNVGIVYATNRIAQGSLKIANSQHSGDQLWPVAVATS